MRLLLSLCCLVAAASAGRSLGNDARCPARDGAFPVYFRDDDQCNVFYQCSNGVAYYFECPAGTVFDTDLNVCNWPDAVDCEDGSGSGSGDGSGDSGEDPFDPVEPVNPEPEPEPKPEPKPTSAPKPDDDASLDAKCKDVPHNVLVQFKDPKDCTKFYKCAQGKAWSKSCPDGLHYNAELEVCDYPERAGCEEFLEYHKA